MTHERVDLLAFSPHPDDIEIACGGTLLLASRRGLRVAVADMSAGERASRGTVEQRVHESRQAADLLGLCGRFCLELPDTEIGSDPSHRQPVIDLIRRTHPRVVLAPYHVERHPDHEAASRLVRDACFLAGVAAIGSGCPYRPRTLYYYMLHSPSFTPSFIVDVTPVWQQRMAALMAHRSQVTWRDDGAATSLGSPGFLRYVEARGAYFGAMIGAGFGEAFLSSAPLPFDGLPALDRDELAGNALPPYTPF